MLMGRAGYRVLGIEEIAPAVVDAERNSAKNGLSDDRLSHGASGRPDGEPSSLGMAAADHCCQPPRRGMLSRQETC